MNAPLDGRLARKFRRLSWFVRRREVSSQTEADATALIAELGASLAPRPARENRTPSPKTLARWSRAAIVIARRTGTRIGLDTATRMARTLTRRRRPLSGNPNPRRHLASSTPWTSSRRRSRAAIDGPSILTFDGFFGTKLDILNQAAPDTLKSASSRLGTGMASLPIRDSSLRATEPIRDGSE